MIATVPAVWAMTLTVGLMMLTAVGRARRLPDSFVEEKEDCAIPQELAKGTCRSVADCPAYQKITNDRGLNSIEQEQFEEAIRCGRRDGSEVCCPTLDRYRVFEELKDEVCGIQAPMFRIRGGVIAEIDEFPWTAMILRQNRDSGGLYYHCGGALISRNFVLTAAHCISPDVEGKKQDPLKFVRLREYNIYQDPDCMLDSGFLDCSDEKLDYKPRKLLLHPSFNLDSATHNHDLGLIEIDPVPPYSDFLRPICLPELDLDNGARPGGVFNVAGWGQTDFFDKGFGSISFSPIKLKVVLPFVAPDLCKDVYEGMNVPLHDSQLCAGGRKAKDSCAGDSGSPLMHYDRETAVWVLTGVASFGVRDCGRAGVPGVYTNVREHLSWIKQNIQNT
ncbi:CLIP domain-containing serine protease B8-like [Malaya genurostris]|uniref:CLIP domain-containing serine protease B8-like n=1 Tax=Malaya genurostris TaxID=325434 RepID=UPI0026F3C1C8|nr:CLIP domain-containing serine protease B8-like [Malaya genurostris]